jgi:hypothetical protein
MGASLIHRWRFSGLHPAAGIIGHAIALPGNLASTKGRDGAAMRCFYPLHAAELQEKPTQPAAMNRPPGLKIKRGAAESRCQILAANVEQVFNKKGPKFRQTVVFCRVLSCLSKYCLR